VTLSLFFTPAARLEALEAQDWYEREAPGLGARFRAELDRQVERIRANPWQFPLMQADVRRARLRKYPYGLYFRVLDDAIYVIACFHSSRNPANWQSRI
jgi:plasmid stabilization system protein ParE